MPQVQLQVVPEQSAPRLLSLTVRWQHWAYLLGAWQQRISVSAELLALPAVQPLQALP
jgi:hypothetical protein